MKIKQILVSAAVAFMLAPTVAAAESPQDKAMDQHGQPIWDARGGCVRTKWESAHDTCGGAISKEARTVYFDFNKSSIKSSEKAKLDSLVRAIKGRVSSVDIVGHADQIGNGGYNDKLSRKRAEAVKSYLLSRGVKTRNVMMKAVGESEPVTNCDPKMARAELIACLAADRRVTIELNYNR